MALFALAAAGCGSSSPTKTSLVSQAVTPNPVVAVPATDGHAWQATFTVTFSEQGGVGVKITSLSAILYETIGGAIGTSVDAENARIVVASASSRLEANGTLVVNVGATYTLPNGGRTALVRIGVAYVDDTGQPFVGTVDVPIT
jgi:methylmalonyl-CoA mutase cobalamin-binding subunit